MLILVIREGMRNNLKITDKTGVTLGDSAWNAGVESDPQTQEDIADSAGVESDPQTQEDIADSAGTDYDHKSDEKDLDATYNKADHNKLDEVNQDKANPSKVEQNVAKQEYDDCWHEKSYWICPCGKGEIQSVSCTQKKYSQLYGGRVGVIRRYFGENYVNPTISGSSRLRSDRKPCVS